jgi:hypothetical protein
MTSDTPVDDSPPPGPLELCKLAGFSYPVFISWPHQIQDRGREIVEAVSRGLENRFQDDGGAQVFLDTGRVKPGYQWDEVIRTSLCRSAVTIVFLVRSYFNSEYCRTEWAISEALSALRLNGDRARSAIIPVVLSRGMPLPREVSVIQFDRAFQELLVFGRDVTQHEKWRQLVDEMTESIYELLERLSQGTRDWRSEEQLAREAVPKRFTWPTQVGSGAPRPKAAFPRLSVEKPAA